MTEPRFSEISYRILADATYDWESGIVSSPAAPVRLPRGVSQRTGVTIQGESASCVRV